jgi:hypothetical protein
MDKTLRNGYMQKIISLIAAAMILLCGFMQSVSAQTTPNPTVPEFSERFVSANYTEGIIVENSSLVIAITNQPFEPFKFRNGFTAAVYYDIRIEYNIGSNALFTELDGYPAQSDSNLTTISLLYINNTISLPLTFLTASKAVEINSPVSIQIQEKIGYITPDIGVYPKTAFVFTGNLSGWSIAQTISLNEVSALPTPSVPEFSGLVILPLLLSSFSVLTIILRRLKNTNGFCSSKALN